VPTQELADELLIHDVAWLREQRDLLWDERQLVLYGPPGTGKTYLALKLAEFLGGGPEQVKLVQFHPSYAYEDFFEGFRPHRDEQTGEVAFRLTDGPLRELADLASLAACGVVEATPDPYLPGQWRVKAKGKVGEATVTVPGGAAITVRIAPKVPIARLLFLLGYRRSAQGLAH